MRLTAFALAGLTGLWFICAPLGGPGMGMAKAADAVAKSLGTSGNWQARTVADNGTTLCYISSGPSRIGSTIKGRNQTGVLVMHAANGGARDQVSVALGFQPRKGTAVTLRIGKRNYTLQKIQGDRAWSSSDSVDRQIVTAMKKGDDMTVLATSSGGKRAQDQYDLSGFRAAYGMIAKACGL